MCVLCDKVDFAIETLEQLIPMSEWKVIFHEAVSLTGAPKQLADDMMADEKSLMANVYCRIAAVFLVDHLRIHPQHATMMFAAIAEGTASGIHLAEEAEAEDPIERLRNRLLKKLKDLES
jgi:hypothetical protein